MEQIYEQVDKSFIRLPRYLRDRFLYKKLTTKELILLIWLWWDANPNNGVVKTSYYELAQDLAGYFRDKNDVNKTVLYLKKKQYIWFLHRQGCRSSFLIEVANYPLSNKLFKNISHRFADPRVNDHSKQGSFAEVNDNLQKLRADEVALTKQFSINSSKQSRSSNNDTENKNNPP